MWPACEICARREPEAKAPSAPAGAHRNRARLPARGCMVFWGARREPPVFFDSRPRRAYTRNDGLDSTLSALLRPPMSWGRMLTPAIRNIIIACTGVFLV
jgi:hypothetical protein